MSAEEEKSRRLTNISSEYEALLKDLSRIHKLETNQIVAHLGVGKNFISSMDEELKEVHLSLFQELLKRLNQIESKE